MMFDTMRYNFQRAIKMQSKWGFAYCMLAKSALWLCATALFAVFVGSIIFVLQGDRTVIGHIISSAQVLSFISVSVLGYHNYKGFLASKESTEEHDQEYDPPADDSSK